MGRAQYRSEEEQQRCVGSELSGLTLVLGPPNSGKMGHVLGWWHERLASRPILVTPTGPGARELTIEMVRRAGALVGQSPAVTFDGLVGEILGWAPRHPTGFERTLVMSRLLRRAPLRSLGRVGSLPGAAMSLAGLVLQLGEGGRDVEEVADVLRKWALLEPAAADLAEDILLLHESYADTCARWGFTDAPAAVRRATRDAVSGKAMWARPVALYGFTSFTPGQRALIETLSNRVQLLVCLPHDGGHPVNLSTEAEVTWWRARASETVELAPRIHAYSSPAIAYLERNFLRDQPVSLPPPAASGPEGVRFLLASGQRNEAELAAQHIVNLVRDGFKPRDIAVIVRRVRPWSTLLSQVFDSCGIPYHIDEWRLLADTGLGNGFLSALRAVIRDDADALLAYLRSPYSALDAEAAADLELEYRRRAPRGARALAELGERQQPGYFTPLWDCVAAYGGAQHVDVSTLEDMCRRMVVAALRGAMAGTREPQEDVDAFRALSDALATLRSLPNDEDMAGWLDPESIVGALGRILVPGGRVGDSDAVQVLSAQRARARRFAVVVVLGLVEGEFPGRPDFSTFITPQQRARIDALAGGGFLPGETEQEAALFANVVSRAWQLLLLSARDADDGGGEAVPSYFWRLSKELLGVGELGHEARTLADVVFDAGSAPTLRHYLRTCAAADRAPHPTVGPETVASTARDGARRPGQARLSDPEILADLEGMQSFTPSSLEAYLTCPFAWFIERVVGIDDLEYGLDGRVLGQLLHDALSAIYRSLHGAGALPVRRDALGEAEETASVIVDRLVEGGECPGTVAERRVAGWRMKELAGNLFRMESGEDCSLVLSETESRLGGSGGVDVGGLRLRVRLDRVDADPQGQALFVIDYKSGAVPAVSTIGTERGLQLPLYLMALAADRPDAAIVGGAYVSLSEAKRSGIVLAGNDAIVGSRVGGCNVLSLADAQELYRRTLETALRAAEGMRAGLIAPLAERECPLWCRLGPVCRSRVGRSRR